MGESSLRGKYQVRKPLKFRTSRKENIQSMAHHAAQLGNEEPNFPPVTLLLCLQCGSRLPCPTLADEWRSLADVDDCWRVGLLQQINAPGVSVACLEPRAHLNGYESQSQRWPIRRRWSSQDGYSQHSLHVLVLPPSSAGSSTRAPLYSAMNDNGDDSGMIKVAAQDVMLVPAWALQMPAAAVIRRLRNVDVIA